MKEQIKVRSASAQDAVACAKVVVDAYEPLRSIVLMFPNASASRAALVEGRRKQFAAQLDPDDRSSASRHHNGRSDERIHYIVAVDEEDKIVGLLRWSIADIEEDKPADVSQLIESVTLSKLDVLGAAHFHSELFRKFLYATAHIHARHFNRKGRHVVLHTLATLTSHQRRGVGARLMEVLVEHADLQHLTCYLEASEAGKTLYERYGFQIVETIHITDDRLDQGFPLYVMVRAPESAPVSEPKSRQ